MIQNKLWISLIIINDCVEPISYLLCTKLPFFCNTKFRLQNKNKTCSVAFVLHPQGTNTSSLFLYKDVFSLITAGSEIYFFVEATSTNGAVGTSEMKASLNQPPTPGTCAITPTSISVFQTITITCSNWTDDHGIDQYEFYGMKDYFPFYYHANKCNEMKICNAMK